MPAQTLRRIPVRTEGDIVLVPVDHVASIVAERELLHITTTANERFTIAYRLKDLEARLDPEQFVRLSRGTLVNVALIERVSPLSAGTYTVTLTSGARHEVSRLRGRVIREQLLRL